MLFSLNPCDGTSVACTAFGTVRLVDQPSARSFVTIGQALFLCYFKTPQAVL